MTYPFAVDGNWFDICSLAGGLLFAAFKCRTSDNRQSFVSRQAGVDVASGVSLFPLLALSLACLSSGLVVELLHANRLILSVAGVVARLAILED
jgi:hypothetical protein